MNKWEAEVQQAGLDDEKQAIKRIKEAYNKALDDVNEKIQELQNQITQLAMAGADDEATQSMIQSKVYQKQYQEAVRSQINAICDNITAGNYQTINEYLQKSYENGYVGTMYSLHNQGIPLVIPIDQEQVAKAIVHDTNLKDSLYSSLEGGTDALKKSIRSELSRGISQGMSYADISRNISNAMKVDTNKTIRIVRTEGHRINQESTNDAMYNAKDKGADIVKQWDATLDAKTRPSHQMVDGEIRELDEKFSNGLRYPGDPNSSAAEVINCRCVLLQRARWAIDDETGNTKLDNENSKLLTIDSKNYQDFKKIYYKELERNKENQKNFKAYTKAIERGELTPLTDFELYQRISKDIDKELVGITTAIGTKVTGKSAHFVARVIGSVDQRRNGVEISSVLEVLTNPSIIEDVKTNSNGRSQRLRNDKAAVAINPDTGILIQVNPIKKRK